MNAFTHRSWIPFYLVSFGTLSMAVFRSMNGIIFLFSLILVSVALGIIFITIQAEVARNAEKKELTEILSKMVRAAGDSRGSEAK